MPTLQPARSARLIERLLRSIGRMCGGTNRIVGPATALFSGISGSKLADIAAVAPDRLGML
jgi:TRAP-type C4-dicarboxylate transport system permease large subunit